jgi:endoglucanase
VNLLTNNNIAVIINLHFNATGSQRATGQQAMADGDHSNDFWRGVAQRFKSNSPVLFEPYNEPHPDGGRSSNEGWRCWRDGGTCAGVPFVAAGMQEMVNAIRGTGATNIIIATGQNWGSQLDRWLEFKPNDPLNQLAAGWHSYGDGLSCQNETCWNSVLKSVLQQVPIVATEIGQFDCGHSYIDRVMQSLDDNGQGYQAWSWGPFDCRADPALLTSWSGSPTQTYGSGFRGHLQSRP